MGAARRADLTPWEAVTYCAGWELLHPPTALLSGVWNGLIMPLEVGRSHLSLNTQAFIELTCFNKVTAPLVNSYPTGNLLLSPPSQLISVSHDLTLRPGLYALQARSQENNTQAVRKGKSTFASFITLNKQTHPASCSPSASRSTGSPRGSHQLHLAAFALCPLEHPSAAAPNLSIHQTEQF